MLAKKGTYDKNTWAWVYTFEWMKELPRPRYREIMEYRDKVFNGTEAMVGNPNADGLDSELLIMARNRMRNAHPLPAGTTIIPASQRDNPFLIGMDIGKPGGDITVEVEGRMIEGVWNIERMYHQVKKDR